MRWTVALALTVAGAIWWVLSWALHIVGAPLALVIDSIGRAYPGGLRSALRWRWAVLPVAFGLFLLSAAALRTLGTDLVPDLALGQFAFKLRAPEGTTLETTADVVSRIERAVARDSRLERVFSVVGSVPSTASGRQTVGENLAQIDFVMKGEASQADEEEVVGRVREVLSRFPSIDTELVHPSVLTVRPPVAVRIFANDLVALDDAAGMIANASPVSTASRTSPPRRNRQPRDRGRDRPRARSASGRPGRDARADTSPSDPRGVVGQFREAEERLDIRLRSAAEDRDRGRTSPR